MSLQKLAEIVFRRGCNVSLEYMLRSETYRALVKEAHDMGLVEPEDSALVQLLGAKLADRAFQNMPWSIRSKVSTWHDGLSAQIALLELIFGELNGSKWRESATRQYQYNSDARCVLPAETGSWTRGPARPNCLGVAQMMVGFARAVGARHYLANVLRVNQDTLHTLETRLFKGIADVLRPHSYLDEFTQKIDDSYVKALERTNTDNQAHHALVIQTEDGKWWVVDPYLRTIYCLSDNPHRDKALVQLTVERNKMLTTDNRITSLDQQVAKIEMLLRVIGGMCALINRSDELLLNDLSHMVAFGWLCEKPITDPEALGHRLATLQVDATSDQMSMASLALVHAMHEDVPSPVEMMRRLEQEPTQVTEHFKACQQRATDDPSYKLHIATRLVRSVLRVILELIDELNDRADMRQHESLEIGWAPMALGVATLNHMQFEDPGSLPPLRGRLAELLKSQWVMYDALIIAQQQGEPIDPNLMAKIQEHLARFADEPDLVIVPLHLLRSKDRGR